MPPFFVGEGTCPPHQPSFGRLTKTIYKGVSFSQNFQKLPINMYISHTIIKNFLWEGVPIKIYFLTKLLKVYYKGVLFSQYFQKVPIKMNLYLKIFKATKV